MRPPPSRLGLHQVPYRTRRDRSPVEDGRRACAVSPVKAVGAEPSMNEAMGEEGRAWTTIGWGLGRSFTQIGRWPFRTSTRRKLVDRLATAAAAWSSDEDRPSDPGPPRKGDRRSTVVASNGPVLIPSDGTRHTSSVGYRRSLSDPI